MAGFSTSTYLCAHAEMQRLKKKKKFKTRNGCSHPPKGSGRHPSAAELAALGRLSPRRTTGPRTHAENARPPRELGPRGRQNPQSGPFRIRLSRSLPRRPPAGVGGRREGRG